MKQLYKYIGDNMKLSVVIPVYNALLHTIDTIQSVLNATKNLKELILVDDASDKETEDFLLSLKLDPRLNIRLTKTRNPSHLWTNASWNIGVELATSEYIAVINSDILLSDAWDSHLIKTLESSTIACPYLGTERLASIIEKIDPNMIQGPAFMFKREDRPHLFPIHESLTHWYGDRLLADRANSMRGVGFNKEATISHAVTQSGRLIDKDLYQRITYNDMLAYERLSGKTEDIVRGNFKDKISL